MEESEFDKYYTPKLEEFHYGFEFEVIKWFVLTPIGANAKNEPRWVSTKIEDLFDYNDVLDIFYEAKENHELRVKYLDREDIESFGFIYDENGDYYYQPWSNNGTRQLTYRVWHTGSINPVTAKDDISRHSILEIAVVDTHPYNVDGLYHKSFNVKNKSELKKILENHG